MGWGIGWQGWNVRRDALLGGSLRLRLLAGSLVWVTLAVVVAGWGLRALFAEHITRQFQAHLSSELDHLSSVVDWLPEGRVIVRAAASDPRLSQPLSGLYWQVDQLGELPRPALARSRSLWDQVLTLPVPGIDGAENVGDTTLYLKGPRGHDLLGVARVLVLPEAGAPPLRLVMAGDQALLAEPMDRFTRLLLLALGILALGLTLGVAVQLQLALHPLRRLRSSLSDVHEGRVTQLSGVFPQELQPLVRELNHVLAQNAEMVARARTQAGNLAHALRTPLTILANAANREEGELAYLVREQTAMASRQVDYHLSQSRAVAAAATRMAGLRTPVLPAIRALLLTMQRLHAARGLQFVLSGDAQDVGFRGEAQDLYELLGNLLDNAGKWARTQVLVEVEGGAEELCIHVDDDGPGVPEAARAGLFERGVRLDECRPGVGFGLDIVRTLAQTYGGRVSVQASRMGGARFSLYLPQVEPAATIGE